MLLMPCRKTSLYEFYQRYWINFGRILTDMESYGMMVNREHLRAAQVCRVRRSASLGTDEKCFSVPEGS